MECRCGEHWAVCWHLGSSGDRQLVARRRKEKNPPSRPKWSERLKFYPLHLRAAFACARVREVSVSGYTLTWYHHLPGYPLSLRSCRHVQTNTITTDTNSDSNTSEASGGFCIAHPVLICQATPSSAIGQRVVGYVSVFSTRSPVRSYLTPASIG